jgi:hypothetical protein
MSTLWRRFELLLPRQLNNGQAVPAQVLDAAVSEVLERFGAASSESQTIQGLWRQGGRLYHDPLMKIFVDVPDTEANREWMRNFKERWRERLEQIELWMVSYPIEVE